MIQATVLCADGSFRYFYNIPWNVATNYTIIDEETEELR